jgi:hypothetical protein
VPGHAARTITIMTLTPDARDARLRCASLIATCLSKRPEFQPLSESPGVIQVERGGVLPMALSECPDVGQILHVAEPLMRADATNLRIVDAAGHERSHYAGLLLYAWRTAFARISPRLSADERARWEQAMSTWAAQPNDSADVGGRAWWSLAGRRREAIERLIEAQQPSGAFLRTDRSRNPETTWFEELVILHAVGAYAVREHESEAAERAMLRATGYHLNETQPDHATNEPWGLLPFILNPATRSVADQMLHTVRVLHPKGVTGVTAILMADVLDCLRA